MTRASWNPNLPDVVGVEFLGVGVATNIIQTGATMRALRFKPQRTGTVDQVAVYSGAATNNPVLPAAHFLGHRKPFLVELYPASGFDPGGSHSLNTYTSTLTTFSNVVNQTGGAPNGDELAVANDNKFLTQSGGSPSQVQVHMASADTFPLGTQVMSVAIEFSALRSMSVRRLDNDGQYLWNRVLPAGLVTWHMAEAFIEHGTTDWRLWSPQAVRQFNSGVGSRRIQMRALNTAINIMDLLRIHVDYVPERRAGVAIIEPPGTYQWVSGTMFNPTVTGSPATVLAGQEYIVLVRCPSSSGDYETSGAFDWRAVKDTHYGTSGFQHYTLLDWDLRDVVLWENDVPRALGSQLDGLPALRLNSGGLHTVDSQPYSGSTSGTVPFSADSGTVKRPRQQLQVPAGSTVYGSLKVNMAVLPSPLAPTDRKWVDIDLVNNADALIAGPFRVTEAMVAAAPVVGTDIFGDAYSTVTVDFDPGIDINEAAGVRARFTLATGYGEPGKTNNVWRIGAMVAEVIATGLGDQTAPGAATGHAFIPPSNAFLPLQDTTTRLSDLQVQLLSQPPAITGASVQQLSQPVTGGSCVPCVGKSSHCTVTSIPYNRVCWHATTLTQDKFGYYEVQRLESATMEADWETVAIIAPTGTPVTGVSASGTAATCWDDWSHVYDSQVCYRIRQQRVDGTLSDFVETVCRTTVAPAGADIIVTLPDEPERNIALPEAYPEQLPIKKEWTNLDADSHVIQAVYGRDKHISFRPIERLGFKFQRQVLISSLCTTTEPCLNVIEGLHEVCDATTGIIVVRDACGNRWYATLNVPTFTNLHDPDVGDMWLADIVVTELATPIISAETVNV